MLVGFEGFSLEMHLFTVLAAAVMMAISNGAATPSAHQMTNAVSHLARYGYIRQADADALLTKEGRPEADAVTPTPSQDVFKKALVKFQTYANITVTGDLDHATLEVMQRPRCGFKDFNDGEDYTLLGGKWTEMPVTYTTTIYTPDLPLSTVDATFAQAFAAWDIACGISFVRTCAEADILIQFGSYCHGDLFPFDGPGNVLAHAYNPGTSAINGDAHFDESETWTLGTTAGINLYQVALHEFGHSLGLGHSQFSNAVMYPYYTGYKESFPLTADDIAGCRALYGA